MGNLQSMYQEFKELENVKRIISFGGWSFSTEYDTFPIFREGVTPAQRQRFADNVVQVKHLTSTVHLVHSVSNY